MRKQRSKSDKFKMRCPKCKKYNTEVIDTRTNMTFVSRVRACNECMHVFTTKETVDETYDHPKYKKLMRELQQNQIEIFNNNKEEK